MHTGAMTGPAAAPPPFEPEHQTKCQIAKSRSRPLVVEWPSAARAELESRAERGLVVVRYQGCEIEVLPRCEAVAKPYRYVPTTRQKDSLTIRDEDELYANVPVGAAGLSGKLAQAGRLDVAMTVVGRWEADMTRVQDLELLGECAGASHVAAGLRSARSSSRPEGLRPLAGAPRWGRSRPGRARRASATS